MKFVTRAALAATALVSLAATPAFADPIVYNGSQLIGAFQATYSVTTNGTIGAGLTQNIVTAYSVKLEDGVGVAILNNLNSSLSGLFDATSTSLTFSNNYQNFTINSFATGYQGKLAATLDLTPGYQEAYVCTSDACRASGEEGRIDLFASAEGVATAAPEPATWAMMLAGFGAAGVALRRKAKVKTKVSYA
jgi:hypothetical protein